MANEEQLSILKKGTKVWNQWREENRKAIIDLSEADLSLNAEFVEGDTHLQCRLPIKPCFETKHCG
jgi:hypothetical protein